MLSSRLVTRQLRSPILRQLGRRQASGGSTLHGAADNAFNRERAAVKDHAAATSGKHQSTLHLSDLVLTQFPDLWRKLSI